MTHEPTRRVLHAARGAAFTVPADWEEVEPPAPDAVVAVEPARDLDGTPPFRASLVLTAVDNQDLTFRDWQVVTDEMLPGLLTDYLLLDLERLTVAGHPGGRRLAHHLSPEGAALTMEQWFTQVDRVGYTLTATVDSWRYDEVADVLRTYATELELPMADRL